MPVFLRGHQDGRPALTVVESVDLGDRFVEHAKLDPLPLAIEFVQPPGNAGRLVRIVGGKQPGAESGLADPPPRIDAWTEDEAGVIGSRRLVDTGDVGQRPNSRIGPARHDFEALNDEGAIDPPQRHHVADGPQGHQVQPLPQIRFGATRVVTVSAQDTIDRHHHQKRHPHRRQVAASAGVVQAIGVDDGGCPRQPAFGRVVIADDDVETGVGGSLESVESIDAAIDGDHHRNALGFQPEQRLGAGAIAFLEAIGHVQPSFRTGRGQEPGKQRRRRRPVDVVVPEHRDPFALYDRPRQSFGAGVHVLQAAGIGQKLSEGGVEEGVGLIDPDPSPGQHPTDHFRDAEPLRQRQCRSLIRQTHQPALAGQRPFDAQNACSRRGCRYGERGIGSAHLRISDRVGGQNHGGFRCSALPACSIAEPAIG